MDEFWDLAAVDLNILFDLKEEGYVGSNYFAWINLAQKSLKV